MKKQEKHRRQVFTLKHIFMWLIVLLLILFIIDNTTSRFDFRLNFFEHNNVYIQYVEYEKENAPIIFFLHGAGSQATTYKKNLSALAKKYHVIAPNIPIFGLSSVPGGNWNFIDFAEYFEEFLNQHDLDNVIGIGHSFGGGILANLANITSRIDYLILVDSVGGPSQQVLTPDWYDQIFKKDIPEAFMKDFLITLRSIGDLAFNIIKNVDLASEAVGIIQNSLDTEYDYSDIKIPVTIFWGETDPDAYFSTDLARYFEKEIKNSELIFVGGGHNWLLFEPDRFFELVDEKIENFLNSN